MAGERIDLKVGFACNNRCVFCAQGHKRDACDAMPADQLAKKLVDGAGPGKGLVLTGGEPTLHKKLLPLIRLASQLGYSPIQVQTNGRLLRYPNVLDALIAAGANEFSPSLHGSRAEVHDALTRAPGSFDDSVAGIEAVAKRGISLVTNSVVTRSNLDDLPDLVALLARLGVRLAQLAFVHPVGTAMELFDETVPRLPDASKHIRRAREVALAAGVTLVTEAMPLCFLRGMEELAVESRIPQTTVLDLEGPLDYERWRRAEGKAHGDPCTRCSRARDCEGPWREYTDRWGWDEFEPIA